MKKEGHSRQAAPPEQRCGGRKDTPEGWTQCREWGDVRGSSGMGRVGPVRSWGDVDCSDQGSGPDVMGRAVPAAGDLRKPAPNSWVPLVSLLLVLATKQTYVTYSNHAL